MALLVTLGQAKEHLRVDASVVAYDDDITQKVEDASGIVIDYLKLATLPTGWEVQLGDSPALAGAPRSVQAAVLLVLGELFQSREAGDVDLLSLGVVRLLERQRDPTLA